MVEYTKSDADLDVQRFGLSNSRGDKADEQRDLKIIHGFGQPQKVWMRDSQDRLHFNDGNL